MSQPRQQLVLLHGWGSNRDVWRPLVTLLRPWADLTLLDIPGLAPGVEPADPGLDSVLDEILRLAPEQAVYLGWSLGGQLAMALAARAPERVLAVVTLCSSPRFLAAADWVGMADAEMRGFCETAAINPGRALRRFDSLQVAGAETPRQLLRTLQGTRSALPGEEIVPGLDWLQGLDLRTQYSQMEQPQLHLLSELDRLLPAALAQALGTLLAATPLAETAVLPRCAHPAPLQAADEISSLLCAFLQKHNLLRAVGQHRQSLAKKDVAQSFSKAATAYDSVAQLQRDVGAALMSRLDGLAVDAETVLDLGSGTGYFQPLLGQRFPEAAYLGLDLAEGMVRYARGQHGEAAQWLVGDAEMLPLAAASVDLVFSSLALQWCQRPELLFAEFARVLRPGGYCVFTSLGPETLRELRAAWAAADQYQHVNSFLPVDELQQSCAGVPQLRLSLSVQQYQMRYGRVRDLLHELKTLGAHNVNSQRSSGLTGRRALQDMMQAYEDWRTQDGMLPASYEVIFGVVERT